MSLTDRLQESGVDRLAEQLGGAGWSYAPPGGDVEPLAPVAVGPLTTTTREDLDGRREERSRNLTVSMSDPIWEDFPEGPLAAGTVTGPDGKYAVEKIEDRSDAMAVLRLIQISPAELTRPSYRR